MFILSENVLVYIDIKWHMKILELVLNAKLKNESARVSINDFYMLLLTSIGNRTPLYY